VEDISVHELAGRLRDPDDPLQLLDIREDWEVAVCVIEGSRHMPMNQVPDRLPELPADAPLAVICHHGVRSRLLGRFLEQQGFSKVLNVAGGIEDWAREIDSSLSRY
jgi:rhodanese-related sulfurtransferase